MVNNSTNINKSINYLLPQIIKHKQRPRLTALGQAQKYGVVISVNILEPELFLTINVHIFFLDVITHCNCIVIGVPGGSMS